MFCSVRRFRVAREQLDEALHLVDTEFAEELQGLDGFVAYQCLSLEDGTVMSVTTCTTREACEESVERSQEWIRRSLSHIDIERIDAMMGSLDVSRARSEMLEPAHH
jgi:hypothetical protein